MVDWRRRWRRRRRRRIKRRCPLRKSVLIEDQLRIPIFSQFLDQNHDDLVVVVVIVDEVTRTGIKRRRKRTRTSGPGRGSWWLRRTEEGGRGLGED